MTTTLPARMTIAEALERLMKHGIEFGFEAFDGSSGGPVDAPFKLRLLNRRGLAYLLTAPGDLGFARAYISGDLEVEGAEMGNPYDAMHLLLRNLSVRVPSPNELVRIIRSLGLDNLKPPKPPAEENVPKWRRTLEGLRHSKVRDAEAIHHHYDVSNTFYEYVLGPSMTYTCAVFPQQDSTLEEAQYEKHDLICRKLGLTPGDRLLDVGCGWGGMVRHAAKHYGARVIGVTLSEEQATWAAEGIRSDGLEERAEVRFGDYRDVAETDFDAISSIGLTEHIGVKNYPAYFSFLTEKLADGGRLLNHCITRRDDAFGAKAGAFIDRYVFPDGELAPVGTIASAVHDNGLEVRHVEDLREHYALTLKAWCENLEANWDQCLDEVTLGRAKIWGLYMAGSRIAFERNEIGLHHVLAVKTDAAGDAHFPLRPYW